MPKGVEHNVLAGATGPVNAMRNSVMPKGVEHKKGEPFGG